MAELKTRLNDANVDEFIAAVDDPQMRTDCEKIIAMMSAATGEPPRMWGKSIVGFGSYHYVYPSGREGDWMQIGFSPRKRNLTLYVMPGFDSYGPLLSRLGKHKTGKSCLYIKRLADIDEDVLQQLIDASIVYMRKKYETS